MGRIAGLNRLTPREQTFFRAYVKGKTQKDAYLEAFPGTNEESASTLSGRLMKRIQAKVDWPKMLESAGLGETRLAREIEARLTAMETKFYQAQVIGDFEDNGTRMRATELLSRLLGKDKAALALTGPEGGPIEVSLIKRIVVKPGEEADGTGNQDT
jgi:hypothetical protein